MAIYQCDTCGKLFSKRGLAATLQTHHFCSMDCRRIHEGREPVECETCGKVFYKKRAERESRPTHYCSIECYRTYQRQGMVDTKICPVCGKAFIPSGYGEMRRNQMYCSHECKGLAHRGENNPAWLGGHPAYRGPDWPTIRKRVLILDKHQCVLCGTQKGLNVHHIEPYRIAQNNDVSNLATLCDRCHGIADRDYVAGFSNTEQLIRKVILER